MARLRLSDGKWTGSQFVELLDGTLRWSLPGFPSSRSGSVSLADVDLILQADSGEASFQLDAVILTVPVNEPSAGQPSILDQIVSAVKAAAGA